MKRWSTIAILAFAVVSFGESCDGPPKQEEGKAPTPAKIAGWTPGVIRLCALIEGVAGDSVAAAVQFGSAPAKDIILTKSDKGFCSYGKIPWRNQSTYLLMDAWVKESPSVPSNGVKEVGVYYVDDAAKTNPADDDFKYIKAIKDEGDWWVVIEAQTVIPVIKVPCP